MKTMSETIDEANNRSKGIRNPYDYLYKPGEDRKNFPEALHDMSNDDKINYFESKIISHARLSQMEKEILDYIKHPKKKILLVLGPPQIGKSTLLENVNMSILAEYVPKMNDDPGFIPITWVEAFNSRRKVYDWKPVYSSAYEILNEALDSKLISRTKSPLGKGEAGYRDAFIKALKNRHTKILQIDEGHLLVYVSDKRGQLEEIKTISNISKALIIIYGTYALAEFMRPNAQLALRNQEFHFSRYKPLNVDPDDFNNFVDAIGTFQNFLPVKNTPQLVDHAEYIYLNTAGCVGVLKVWLQSCLSDSLEKGGDIDADCLARNKFAAEKLNSLSKEIKLGEGYISKTYEWNEEIEKEIEKNLGIKPLKGTDEATKSDNKSDNVKSPTSPTMNARRRVGRRAPHRDSKSSSVS